jgi:hypothetical protein
MSTPELLPALPEPSEVLEVSGYRPEQHSVVAYLARLGTPLSREGMLRRLNIVARLLSGDTLEAMHFPWHTLTYVQLVTFQERGQFLMTPARAPHPRHVRYSVRYQARLDAETSAKIEELARTFHRKRSVVLRELVRLF